MSGAEDEGSNELQAGFNSGYKLHFELFKEILSIQTQLELLQERLQSKEEEKENLDFVSGQLEILNTWRDGVDQAGKEGKAEGKSTQDLEPMVKKQITEIREIRGKIENSVSEKGLW